MLPPSTLTHSSWPPDYVSVWQWRQEQILRIRSSPDLLNGALAYYEEHPVDFILHWMDTYDPRNAGTDTPTRMPFVLFKRQEELIRFLLAMIRGREDGLIEKCRDMGATWVACALSVWLWRFYDGASVGWGSRKESLVDKSGDPDSIFEKMRMLIRNLPREFLPLGFDVNNSNLSSHMRIVNPENGATITGEAGDNIGRGGRKLIYFKDESAHYERPEMIEAALSENTNTQIDISSVNGPGNVFHRRREGGQVWEHGSAHKGVTNVFVMDYTDHPAKSEEWYETKRKKAESVGLLHIFNQEINRQYGASIEGTIIPFEWTKSAIDAHKTLGWEVTGPVSGGLDVGDGGMDKDALTFMKGPLVFFSEAVPNKNDSGETARWAIRHCESLAEKSEYIKSTQEVFLQYDSVGVGSGVKSESNRLAELDDDDPNKLPSWLKFVNWSAGAGVLNPDEHIIPGDDQSPLNKDFFDNLKAQAWWELRLAFYRTHRAVTEGIEYKPEEMISLSSEMPMLQQLRKELSQAVAKKSTKTLKLVVDKNPPGTSSPNQADSLVEAHWPIPDDTPVVQMFLRGKR